MLNAIRIWAAAVCAAAVAASVAQLAAPEGKIQKALRCVIGLFFVCALWRLLRKVCRCPLEILKLALMSRTDGREPFTGGPSTNGRWLWQ